MHRGVNKRKHRIDKQKVQHKKKRTPKNELKFKENFNWEIKT